MGDEHGDWNSNAKFILEKLSSLEKRMGEAEDSLVKNGLWQARWSGLAAFVGAAIPLLLSWLLKQGG